jgi:tRNA-specific 2-thiouridylase
VLDPSAGAVEVKLLEPAVGVAPGQSAVFYQGDEVLGGGTIAAR